MEPVDFNDIFTRIKGLLSPYSSHLSVAADTDTTYQLYVNKAFEFGGRQFPGCHFSSTTIQKTMVAWYFFPYYTHPQAFTIPDAIKKNLKGKNCFNFKKLDEEQEKAIAQLLREGEALYKKGGLI